MSYSFVTLWTAVDQDPLSTGFSKQAYWSDLPFPTPGESSQPRESNLSPDSPALVGGFFTTWATWEASLYTFKNPDNQATTPNKSESLGIEPTHQYMLF